MQLGSTVICAVSPSIWMPCANRVSGDCFRARALHEFVQGSARILFIRGKPVSSDATGSLGHTRKGDVTQVRLGSGLSFDLPDALVSGG